jgi:DNA-binding IscR family transcriptional regulator
VEGPFAAGGGPERDSPRPTTVALQAVWSVVRANERAVLESVTLADLVCGRLPEMTTLGRMTGA